MITKTLTIGLVLAGSIGLASADFTQAMRHYDQQQYREALQEFRESADRGDAYSQYMLGRLHEAGNGTTQDFVQAHKWYNLAAANGHRHADEARDLLAERMTSGQVAQAQQAARDWQADGSTSSQTSSSSRPPVDSLSEQERVAEVQRELNRLGYDAGPTDGIMGNRSRSAIRQYQADMGLYRDGRATADLLERLRQTKPDQVDHDDRPRMVLQDDFSDGNYRNNPSWTVLNGEFDVDRNGLRSIVDTTTANDRAMGGLNSDRPEDIGLAVLGMILEQRSGTRQNEQTAPTQPASIITNAPVGNDFAMEMDLASREQPGQLDVGLFQGNRPDGTGYRLVYSAGSEPGLALLRLVSGNTEVIARHDGRLELEDGRFHRIRWTRDKSGRMEVHVDDRRLLRVQDNGLRDPFQGVTLVNHGGDYSLRRIRLEE